MKYKIVEEQLNGHNTTAIVYTLFSKKGLFHSWKYVNSSRCKQTLLNTLDKITTPKILDTTYYDSKGRREYAGYF